MKEKKIRVLVRRAGQEPTVEVIANTLAAKQQIVGGMIEIPYNPSFIKGVELVCNEEGKFLDDPKPNVYWGDMDVVFGDIFFTAHNEEGDAVSLSPEQIEEARKFIEENDASDFEGNPEDLAYANFKVSAPESDQDFFNALFGVKSNNKDKDNHM